MRSRIPVLILIFCVMISCTFSGKEIQILPVKTNTPLPPMKMTARTNTPLPPAGSLKSIPGATNTAIPGEGSQRHVDIQTTLEGTPITETTFEKTDCGCEGYTVIRASADVGYLDCSYTLSPNDSSTFRIETTLTQQSTVENLQTTFDEAVANAKNEAANLYSGESVTFPLTPVESYEYLITSAANSSDTYCGRGELVTMEMHEFLEDINLQSCTLPKPVNRVMADLADCMEQAATLAHNRIPGK